MSPKPQPIPERFFRYVSPEPNTGCWLWIGYLYPNGYGNFNAIRGHGGYAHRYSYELHKGKIPKGKHLDHLCRVKCCVNPDHLEIVTPKENAHRSPITNATKTHCNNGHEYNEKNTYYYLIEGKFRGRHCRVCGREFKRKMKGKNDIQII